MKTRDIKNKNLSEQYLVFMKLNRKVYSKILISSTFQIFR